MKSIIIVILCLLLIVAIWIVLYYYSISKVTSFYWDELENLSSMIKNDEWYEVNENINAYIKKWEKTRILWMHFLHQHEIDGINISIYKLEEYINTKNIPLSLGEIEELKYRFRIVDESECLSLENIF